MKLSTLKPAKGSIRKNKRLGRGQGSGRGGTSTRGHKGAQSRSGYSRKLGFEGGQMPIQRRVPKFGFKNNNKIYFKPINLDALEKIASESKKTSIDRELMIEKGLASKKDKIKVLGRGQLNAKIEVKAHAFSKAAIAAIEKSGGKAITIE